MTGVEKFVEDLREFYGNHAVTTRQAGTTLLVKLMDISIPRRREKTDVLLEIPEGSLARGERPRVYVRDGTKQPNGRPGKNVTATQVHGETWLTFSWEFGWVAAAPAWALVEGAVRRFAHDED